MTGKKSVIDRKNSADIQDVCN